ncbi:hypothetical protein PALA111701_17815 [Paenibacillus lactis]
MVEGKRKKELRRPRGGRELFFCQGQLYLYGSRPVQLGARGTRLDVAVAKLVFPGPKRAYP